MRSPLALVVLGVVMVAATPGIEARAAAAAAQEAELDAFMERVLERRGTNHDDLYRHTVRDRESLVIRGPGGQVFESFHGEYVWYVRDGYMVRSPWEVNGVRVGDGDREAAEQRWLERAREREERRRERQREAEESGEPLEREYFLDFPFEPGNYLVAGREQRDGREVLRVEYYPVKLFEDRDGAGDASGAGEAGGGDAAGDRAGAEWSRRFQKTTLVSMWILPEEHQIVEITFQNVGLEFLPLRWLVQVDDVEASLTMHKPFADQEVWLPRSIRAHGRATIATGSYAIEYALDYFDYREAEVAAKVRFRLPRDPRQ